MSDRFSRFSASTSGAPIKVTTTSSPGDLVHAAVVGSDSRDLVWLFASNTDTVSRTITVQYGGTIDPDNSLVKAFPLPANSGVLLLVSGFPLNGGLSIRAFASAAGVVLVSGYINPVR